jgi:hypothetical protein
LRLALLIRATNHLGPRSFCAPNVPVRCVDLHVGFPEDFMFTKFLAGSFLAFGMLFGSFVGAQQKNEATDCCAKKMACCAEKASACCAAATKLGCCANGQKCCAKDQACCKAVQECCCTGSACCDESKACCGESATKK